MIDTPTIDNSPNTTKDYRARYYYDKFHVMSNTTDFDLFMPDLRQAYLEGLMWCLAYYCKGCISWTWFYPFHYGPMLQDMIQCVQYSQQIVFTLGQPFTPFQQLLGCLPPASATLVPKPYAWLMCSIESPVLEFYPTEFSIDADGKKNPWEAVGKILYCTVHTI
jgi:5'-3' exonuclease